MTAHPPTALGWIDPVVSVAPDWDAARVRRLARRLGYRLVWPPEVSLIPLADRARAAEADAVIAPSPAHLDTLTLDAVMGVADVETVEPRMSFARWSALPGYGE
ncbi:hypothetical protein [Nocardia sp. BMG51109]|uniref:hypothetical protein n=1 Tax=Nocardia sp. BMG51109 TaxID=1056816 RepID=UPI0004636EA8|nr:hypothetical protein [Nocardia sp. BMG51109]